MLPPNEKGRNVSHIEPAINGRVGYSVRVSLAVVALGISLFVLRAAPAFAGQARVFTGSFGGASSTKVDPYPLSGEYGAGAAVDGATHDVYVADPQNKRVEKFGPAGEFILMFGKGVNLTKVLAAAPESEQNVCTAASLDTCQAGARASSPGGFEGVAAVAVDNSSGASKGDVYVSDVKGRVSKFDSAGSLVTGWGDHVPATGQLTGVNVKGLSIEGPFGELRGVAVDMSGNLWVADAGNDGQMLEFRQDSSFITGWKSGSVTVAEYAGIAVDSKDDLYIDIGIEGAEEFDSTGNEIGHVLRTGNGNGEGRARGLAVDPTDDNLYLDVQSSQPPYGHTIERYDESCHPTGYVGLRCTPVESFGAADLHEARGLAVDPSTSTLYALEDTQAGSEVAVFSVETVPDVTTDKATDFTSTSATLNGSINPSGVELKAGLEGCRFEWGETETYGNVVACDKTAAQIGSGTGPVEVSASIAGLQQGKTYHFRLVAGNANDVNSVIDEPSLGGDLAFGPPSIESESAVGVAAAGATLQAQVNPNDVDTRVRVEYGSESGVYSHSTPETELGAEGKSELVSFQLSGLTPGTLYHYRVVAENALGEGAQAAMGTDRVFVTQTGVAGAALPDGRGWELVSPPDKHGAEIEPIIAGGGIQASAGGDAIAYNALGPTEAEPAARPSTTQVLSRRGVGGWESQDINSPHETETGASFGTGEEYRFFSSDLSLAVAEPAGVFNPNLSAEASEKTPFLRTDFPTGDVGSPCAVSCYRPLVTDAPGYENVPSGTVIAPSGGGSPEFVGASPDLSHVVLRSKVPLVEGAPEGGLYEWSGGNLVLVSVLPLPDGQAVPVSEASPLGDPVSEVARNAVSADGSRVVWGTPGDRHLYVRDTVREQTVQVGSGAVEYQAASSDGSKIFFTEEASGHRDLRECDIVENEGELQCHVTDLTSVGVGEDPAVEGLIAGVSADGSYVYFVSDAVLDNSGVPVPGAQPGDCRGQENQAKETCNLYVRHDGTIKLVAELSGEDGSDWTSLSGLLASVSPSGRWFEFMSDRSLTGYDNRDSVTGKPDEEVYLYDASANGGEGSVVCASCDPTGARPHGTEARLLSTSTGGLTIGLTAFAPNQGIAASVPGWFSYRTGRSLYQPRYLSDSGRLFFNSSDALVPQDSNGTGDVYEFEPEGVGDCTTSSDTFTAGSGGCVGLISSGTSKGESAFLDASENGDDVFFLTFSQLSHRDTDGVPDVYDARVGGGFPEAQAPPVCEGDACQSPVSAPDDPTPGSLTYSGPGNPSPVSFGSVSGKAKAKVLSRAQKLAKALGTCRRVRSKRAREKCVASAHRRYGRAKSGRASTTKGKR
jgi:hypothetical protein